MEVDDNNECAINYMMGLYPRLEIITLALDPIMRGFSRITNREHHDHNEFTTAMAYLGKNKVRFFESGDLLMVVNKRSVAGIPIAVDKFGAVVASKFEPNLPISDYHYFRFAFPDAEKVATVRDRSRVLNLFTKASEYKTLGQTKIGYPSLLVWKQIHSYGRVFLANNRRLCVSQNSSVRALIGVVLQYHEHGMFALASSYFHGGEPFVFNVHTELGDEVTCRWAERAEPADPSDSKVLSNRIVAPDSPIFYYQNSKCSKEHAIYTPPNKYMLVLNKRNEQSNNHIYQVQGLLFEGVAEETHSCAMEEYVAPILHMLYSSLIFHWIAWLFLHELFTNLGDLMEFVVRRNPLLLNFDPLDSSILMVALELSVVNTGDHLFGLQVYPGKGCTEIKATIGAEWEFFVDKSYGLLKVLNM